MKLETSNIIHQAILPTTEVGRIHRLNLVAWEKKLIAHPAVGTTEMIPANQELAGEFKLPEFEKYQLTGFSSESQKLPALDHLMPRLTNLWYGKFASLAPKLKIDYLRSGSVMHYGEENAEKLDQVSLSNLQQLFQVAQAVGERRGLRNIKFLNIDLQTGARGALVDHSDIEHRTVHYQQYLMKNADRKDSFSEIVSLNLPTHEESSNTKEFWEISNKIKASILQVAQSAFAEVDPEIREFVKPLYRELLELVNSKDQENKVANRFALVARLVVLASLGGWVVHFNCRSGKDRTGFLDAEVKFLTYQLWRRSQNLPVSEPGGVILPEEKEAWKHILLETGNVDIQYLNTGLRGSKLDHGELKDRVGADLWTSFIGDSRKART